jgi:GNAT superfamily N-acetyltransferase
MSAHLRAQWRARTAGLIDPIPVPEGVTLWLAERQGQDGPYVKLDMIKVDDAEERRDGIGTKVMEDLCAWADRTGTTIALDVGNDWTPKTVLTRWYKSFGFEPNTGRKADNSISGGMVRYPR